MIRLDREGLDYLLQVCADIGFQARRISTDEDLDTPPSVTITFIQTRIAETPKQQTPSPDQMPVSEDDGEVMLDGTKL